MQGKDLSLVQSTSTFLVLVCDSARAQDIWQGLSGGSVSLVSRASLHFAALPFAPERVRRLPTAGL